VSGASDSGAGNRLTDASPCSWHRTATSTATTWKDDLDYRPLSTPTPYHQTRQVRRLVVEDVRLAVLLTLLLLLLPPLLLLLPNRKRRRHRPVLSPEPPLGVISNACRQEAAAQGQCLSPLKKERKQYSCPDCGATDYYQQYYGQRYCASATNLFYNDWLKEAKAALAAKHASQTSSSRAE